MKIFKVGDKQIAICEGCQSLQNATFSLRNVPFSDGRGFAKNILVGTCDKCGCVSVIPQQSVPAIEKQLKRKRESIESRVPAHLIDILNLASCSLGAESDFSQALIKYYIHAAAQNAKESRSLLSYLDNELAAGPAQKRLSIKGRWVAEEFKTIKRFTKLPTNSDVLKAVVLKINDEVLVNPRPTILQQLRNVAAACN